MDDSFKQVLDNIVSLNTKDLKREQMDFEFTDIGKELDSLHDFAVDMKDHENFYNSVPENQQSDIRSLMDQANTTFSLISNFRPAEIANPQDERNRLVGEIKRIYQNLYKFIDQIELYKLKTAGSKVQLANITKEANFAVKEAREDVKKIKSLLETAQKTTASSSVSEYLGIFSDTSKQSKKVATYWLGGSGALALILVIFMFVITKDIGNSIKELTTTPEIVAFVTTKLFFLAIVIYLIQQCIRNYMANIHQSVMNHHRENSLRVFNAMVKSSSGAETTDQILSYLSKTVFEAGETGFFPGKDISKDGPDLIQIFKDISKPK